MKNKYIFVLIILILLSCDQSEATIYDFIHPLTKEFFNKPQRTEIIDGVIAEVWEDRIDYTISWFGPTNQRFMTLTFDKLNKKLADEILEKISSIMDIKKPDIDEKTSSIKDGFEIELSFGKSLFYDGY